ncbi:hypothetical protein BSKO_06015 [Bryopsis sp. KO-2023]|nr:hypothetical protein BSKO_06015 [Bryopsis sp. KO-2023]
MEAGSADFDLLEPCPDIHTLFVLYNDLYFGGKLGACSVEWGSKRMTSCAGICYSRPGGGCIIRLSESLLKYRPTIDLKETLLHEMIHALHFLHKIRDDDAGGHGTKFKEEMNAINCSTVNDPQRPPSGYNISVTHNFYAEVEHFRQHWWQCSSCSKVVKRSMNRPPQKADCPWKLPEGAQCSCPHHYHVLNCGGEFKKIKEPDTTKNKKGKVVKSKPESKNQKSITDFLQKEDDKKEENSGGRNVAADGGLVNSGEPGSSGLEVFKGTPNFLGQAPKAFYPGQELIQPPELPGIGDGRMWLRHLATPNPLGPTNQANGGSRESNRVLSHVSGKRKSGAVEMVDLVTSAQHTASVLNFVNRRKNAGSTVAENTARRKYGLVKAVGEGSAGGKYRQDDNRVIDLT